MLDVWNWVGNECKLYSFEDFSDTDEEDWTHLPAAGLIYLQDPRQLPLGHTKPLPVQSRYDVGSYLVRVLREIY